jgi:rubrerythrin
MEMTDDSSKDATPDKELERQITSSMVPKNEREHWAARKIDRLKAELAAAWLDNAEKQKAIEVIVPENNKYRDKIDTLKAELAQRKDNFVAMERAGAEQARRADQTAAELAAERDLWTCKTCGAMFHRIPTDETVTQCTKCVEVEVLVLALSEIRELCDSRPALDKFASKELVRWIDAIDAAGRGEGTK